MIDPHVPLSLLYSYTIAVICFRAMFTDVVATGDVEHICNVFNDMHYWFRMRRVVYILYAMLNRGIGGDLHMLL